MLYPVELRAQNVDFTSPHLVCQGGLTIFDSNHRQAAECAFKNRPPLVAATSLADRVGTRLVPPQLLQKHRDVVRLLKQGQSVPLLGQSEGISFILHTTILSTYWPNYKSEIKVSAESSVST
jgi:hypothetical protein